MGSSSVSQPEDPAETARWEAGKDPEPPPPIREFDLIDLTDWGDGLSWERAYDGDKERHVDGVPWWELPKPRRWHRCKAQTRGFYTEQCCCGGVRNIGYGKWINRNMRP